MMKKLFLWALLAVFTLPIFAKHVDVETAKTVARTFWEQNLGKQTRATFSDVASQTEFTKFYILNTGDGFVIVSADDIAVPILGYGLTRAGTRRTSCVHSALPWGSPAPASLVLHHGSRISTRIVGSCFLLRDGLFV